jgi:molecular chaperone GrpE
MMQDKAMEILEEQLAATATDQAGQNGAGMAQVAEEAGEPPPLSEAQMIEELRTQLAAAQAKADELTDKNQRMAADFQNSRRRMERQLSEEIERASSHLLKRVLPIIDDLHLAFINIPNELDENTNAWLGGFRQIQKKLHSLFDDEGVTPIPPDGPFDPTRHEAVTSEAHASVQSGHIIDTLRSGYEYKGRVLRPALVRVAL